MKKILLILTLFLSISETNAQAKKPTIMVVPSDVWCNQRGYMLEFYNQGSIVKVPDYKTALQENSNLLIAISKINELMATRGFPLKNLESALKSLESESAEDAMLSSKTSGASVVESPIDKLKKTAKADIIIQITWNVNTMGPKHSVTFNLQGLDAYTDKQIAGASGTGSELIGSNLPVMLETAVLSHMDNFNTQLMSHFDDMFANGREITLRLKKWDSFKGDFETEYGGDELGNQIDNWVKNNTVKGRYSATDTTENMMLFEQVRIPLYDGSGKAIDAKGWAKGLQKYLKDTYKIDSKLMTKGLGQASIVVGEK
ncbi:DUF6175 family protein [Flavobacterium hibernum]|uniref:Lipoprotein n=1 Tax=Flavobacterium hibernum TaxID=37752 RepID=A0A0D0EYB8_9FLAO|nr:DUF6175 family protein [Flavobacterium hibernum]KIO50642.1 hypothetical protein IW18_22065 [Flavobacterium hibernum]OXA87509.1 hypothetical protein B0A73_11325 [Flavobacterium hibernum]PTT04149.1 hypothetical protein DBR27_09745 [Flavobacterium sp. HMWF030]STO14378.1 Uncharacterised protein [Flavobacterium hibernum]